jgi:hypothetical protein
MSIECLAGYVPALSHAAAVAASAVVIASVIRAAQIQKINECRSSHPADSTHWQIVERIG